MILRMWLTRRGIGALRRARAALRLGGGIVAVWLVAGCGNGQSPTEAARLAESRRAEAEAAKIPDVVDALFLGSGPLIPRDGATDCPFQGFWSGYPRGAQVRVRLSSRVPTAVQAGLSAALEPIGRATSGALNVTLETTGEVDPQPGFNEVTVAEVPAPRAVGCSSDAGCLQYRFAGRGLMMGARIVGPVGREVTEYVHDVVGHGVLGLCHIDARLIGGAENSLMSAGFGAAAGTGAPGLTSIDLEAIRSVYASSVNPGAARSTFLAARLVNLQAGQLPRAK
jgi:hypothetical protein